MTSKRSQTKATPALEGWGNGFAAPDMSAFLSAPGLMLGQRMAIEGARFWAKRMRACVDQVEALSHCDTPAAVIEVQTKFLKQIQADYLAEGEVVKDIFGAALDPARLEDARSPTSDQ